MSTLALPGFPAPPKASLSQWDTPRDTAERIARWAGIREGLRVLEPSAGLGALAQSARFLGADVTCVEIDPDRIAMLEADGFVVVPGDFLSKTVSPHDLALLNPPYEEDDEGFDQGLQHVLHALKFAPRVVAHMPLSFIAGLKRHEQLWDRHTLSRLAVLRRRPKYAGSKSTGQRDMATFEIIRGERRIRQSIEWW